VARTEPYGNWESPISAASVARSGGRPDWPGWVGEEIWWAEPRPAEGGRVTLMRLRRDGTGPEGTGIEGTGAPEEVLPAPWNVRNRVIEYGGSPWAAVSLPGDPGGPLLVFTNFGDQRLYRHRPDVRGSEPEPVSPVPARPGGMRFAELFVHPSGQEAWGIRETFTGPAPTDVRRDIVAVPLDGSAAADPSGIRVLAASHHFLTCPRLSPGGSHLSWIGWNHPAMPWDETELCIAGIDGSSGGAPSKPQVLAGGRGQAGGRPVSEAVVQAEWLDERTLAYVSDPDGWWNLYRVRLDDPRPVPLCPREEEFGGAMWKLGQRWFVPLVGGRIAAVHGRDSTRLSVLDAGGTLREVGSGYGTGGSRDDVGSGYTEWASCLAATGGQILGVAASPERPFELVRVDAGTGEATVLRSMLHEHTDPGFLPQPQARTFRGEDGRDIYASVYPPRNPRFSGPRGEPPPFAVFVHGGPTGRAPMVHDLEIAYFTSRGIGVVEVNYGGSTGHGRAYRERLRENWGVVDVADCAAVASALAAEGTADGDRLVIRGGSAGGWTTAASLTSTEIYAGGVICYPILDLTGWRTGETHDFESQYLESLVGPWPQASDRYRDRSPVNRADRLQVPFLLLQGLEDAICPPVQCDRFLERIAGRGIPHAYLAFEGEQHGFRKAETVTAALEAELAFLGQVLGFEPRAVPEIELDK
jgi:dienelactone hydrolase